MLKFFRKYNKHMLASFMALLLVAWLTGDALKNLLQRDETARVVATAFGASVKVQDLSPYYRESQILSDLGLPWHAMWYMTLQDYGVSPYFVRVDRESLTENEWYMLVEWARRQGVEVASQDVTEVMQGVEKNSIEKYRVSAIDMAKKRHSVGPDQIEAAVADFLRVREAVRRSAAVLVTEPELRQRMREVGEKVTVKYALVGAKSFTDPTAAVTDAELKEQFEKYKDVAAGEAGGYGYKLPAAVQIEYVSVNVDELAKQIRVDDQRAYTYWKEHQKEFLKPLPQTQPTSGPAVKRPSTQPYEKYDEARSEVVAKLTNDEAQQAAKKLLQELINRLNQAWEKAPKGADGYLVAPEAVKLDGYLEKEVEAFGSRQYGKFLRYNRTQEVTQDVLAGLPGVGRATAAESRKQTPLHTVAFEIQGLARSDAGEPAGESKLSLFQPCEMAFKDPQNNVYMFRAIKVSPSRSPESIDRVKADVERDVREIKGYKAAGEAARELEKQAAQAGLVAAFDAAAALKQKLGPEEGQVREATFARSELPYFFGSSALQPANVPFVGPDAGFIREAFRLGAPTTASQAQRVAVVELKPTKQWAVVQWVAAVPIRVNEYEGQRRQLVQSLYMDAVESFVKGFYAADQIRARAGWQDAEPQQEAPAEKPKAA